MSISTIDGVGATKRVMPPGRYGISGLLGSEWTKLRTVRSTKWTIAVVVLLGIGLSALATWQTRVNWASMNFANRANFDATRVSLIGVEFAQLVIGILGVMVMSAEYSTGTIRATFSAAPRRPMVLLAKVIVFGTVALVVCEAVSFVAYFLGQSLLSAPAVHTTLSSPGALRAVAGAGIYLCVLGLFATGLAAIIRHTAGAIGAFVAILLVIPLIVGALPSSLGNTVEKFLPVNIGYSLISLNGASTSFAPWPGLALLCAYTAGLLLIGGVLMSRRDA